MWYCFKCRNVFELKEEAFKSERIFHWDRVRKICPIRRCWGYVYDIDPDMIPIIDWLSTALFEHNMDILPIYSCSGHPVNEMIDPEDISVPYMVVAIYSYGITNEHMIDGRHIKHLEEYISKFNNHGGEVTFDIDNPEYVTGLLHDGFADRDSNLHYATEGWIPVTIRYDPELYYKMYGKVGNGIDNVALHCKALANFAKTFREFVNYMKGYKLEDLSNQEDESNEM